MTPLEMDTENPPAAGSSSASASVATTYNEHAGADYDPGDQLPTVEQYKMDMATTASHASGISSRGGNTTVDLDDVYLERGGAPAGDEGSVAGSSVTAGTAAGPPPAMDSEHDQLPSVEEVRATHTTKQKPKTQRCAYIAGMILCIILLLVAIIVPAVLLSKDDEETTTSASAGPATESSRIQEVRSFLDQWQISTKDDLDREGSPQNLAMHWIADEDGYKIQIPNLAQTVSEDISDPFRFQQDIAERSNFIERYGLAVLYYSLGGPDWKYKLNFLEPTHVCEWKQNFIIVQTQRLITFGVTDCLKLSDPSGGFLPEENKKTEYIQRIAFPSNNIRGTLPNEIRLIHRLKRYIMPYSAGAVGPIPDGLRELRFLEQLELQYCNLSGGFPEFIGEKLTKLRFLGLSNNLLTGPVPTNIAKLTDLQLLGLDDNSLSGDISMFAGMDILQALYLEDNLFFGQLSNELFDSWSGMQELDLSNNKIESVLPTRLFDHPQLETVDLHRNKFNGNIPEVSSENKRLKFVALHNNTLAGGVPDSIRNLPNLRHLDVAINKLTSPLPEGLGELSLLRYLFTGDNLLPAGPIPSFIEKLTNLKELSMKDNRLNGQIPTWVGKLTRLQLLDLDTNDLDGSIPGELGLISGLDYLLLNRNKFSGELPSEIGLLRDLNYLMIDDNSLTGNADVICKNPNFNLTFFSADCPGEITCSCCTLCCVDSNTTCNNLDWSVNFDPIWEYDYFREVYAFNQEPVPI